MLTTECAESKYDFPHFPLVVELTRREFNKPLWIAYVDLKSAVDSVDRESLWLLLRRHGIPDKLIQLMK